MSPWASRRPCKTVGCPHLAEQGRARCLQHERDYDARRGSAAGRGYTSRWAATSRRFRARFPLCGMLAGGTVDTENSWCAAEGRFVAAQCVQHRIPHQGEGDPLFYAETNLMSSCHRCNNRRRALREPGAFGR